MVAPVMKVVRSDYWIDPVFDQQFRERPGVTLEVFAARGADEAAWAALSRANVYHVSAAKDELPRQWFVDATLLQRCPGLVCVSSTGAGYDTVDVEACTRAGVAVVNQAGGNSVSVAEHTFGLMLGVSHRMLECDRKMRRQTGLVRQDVMGHEIRGKTLGLVGIGNVGTRVAAIGHAFGMTVLAPDPLLDVQEVERRGAAPVAPDELLARSDFVSLHCPRDKTTLKMMGADAFAHMKQGAIFITTARGGIHDEAALIAALRSGHLAGAGIDVWDNEPPPLDHPLLAMDNVYATFHTAGVTHEARRNMATVGAEQILQVLAGQRPPRLVNPSVCPAFEARLARARAAPS
ncbi:MAG TPA: hydroxyacid dehydrogenase [Ramlibacter sp.]|nr:hydroxyacid dehydrogenase [Ramlibacter sp.]